MITVRMRAMPRLLPLFPTIASQIGPPSAFLSGMFLSNFANSLSNGNPLWFLTNLPLCQFKGAIRLNDVDFLDPSA